MDNQPLASQARSLMDFLFDRVLSGEIEIKGQHVAPLLRELHHISRLEDDKPTQIGLERGHLLSVVTDLRQQIREADPDGVKALDAVNLEIDSAPVVKFKDIT